MAASEVYEEVNRKWKSTCRVLLGGEVGELSDFAGWLSDYNGPRHTHKSLVSGRQVEALLGFYSPHAKWQSFDEVDFSTGKRTLSENDTKDIDSILRALSEQAVYVGNIHLGNSTGVEKSTTVFDSHYIYDSVSAFSSKYLAYSNHVIGECNFGTHCCSNNFQIRSNCIESERCFECSKCDYSADLHYSHGLSACYDCMFCFNLRSKRHCIGNLALPKEKYLQLKTKLLSEMREKLAKDKRLPHHMDLFAGVKPDYSRMKAAAKSMPPQPAEKTDKKVIEHAFSEVSKVVLGAPLSGIDKYGAWLSRSTARFEGGASCATGRELLISDYADFLRFPRGRLLSDYESVYLGERVTLTAEEAERLSLENAATILSPIAYFSPEWLSGNLQNNIEVPVAINSSDCYRGIINLCARRCAYGWWPRNSEYIFGYNRVRLSSFCINCFQSEHIQRCFEVDESRSCSGCYYCYNIENCHDCMFCFNAKNLKNAVANVELPREQYLQVKKKVLEQLNAEIAKTNSVSLSIYNLPDRIAKGSR